ncbi:hypothetical protein F0L68_39730 [Solihabitans fulvus]|uniref:Uncharacterized protein n=1 Tax=Solihabitans fulvus TaxID=1892852 RepID=A0A5B2WDJ4_9PSEU|nr:hypothetical protein [Solihabitans fulvus]KAA2248682.1 hypothetical protein F0L68_39730 [Solihabitans fulvus]
MSTPTVKPASENTTTSPQDKPVIGAETAPVSLGEHTRTWAHGMRRHWTPPDLWEHGRPALKDTWLWARYGQHLPDDEQVRLGSRVTAGIRLPFRALLLYLDWVFERDSRLVAALVLVFVVVQAIHPIF